MTKIESINNDITKISLEDKEIYLVGTAHVSQKSVDAVRDAIKEYTPDVVAVELCEPRLSSLENPTQWHNMNLVEVIKSGRGLMLLSQLVLITFQRKLAAQLNIKPGAEMLEGVTEGRAHGATIALIDRPIKITMKRIWASTNLSSMYQLLNAALSALFEKHTVTEAEIEGLKESTKLSDTLKEFTDKFPGIGKTLIDERDRYMAQKIRDIKGKKVVAIIGAAHGDGIKRYIQNDADISELEIIPPPSVTSKLVSWSIPTVIISLFIAGFFFGGENVGSNMVYSWVIITGLSASLGALVCLAHPITIILTGLSAPITTLHPLISSGMVAALSEAWVKKPKVIDLEEIIDAASGVKGWFTNRVLRVLLLLIITNLFGTLGVIIAAKSLIGQV